MWMPQRKIFVATGILVFDFELFIGELCPQVIVLQRDLLYYLNLKVEKKGQNIAQSLKETVGHEKNSWQSKKSYGLCPRGRWS